MLLERGIPYSYLFDSIRKDIVKVVILSLFLLVLQFFFESHLPKIELGLVASLGTAISLLLAFKLSQSYDRWWEARKVWGAIVNDSRSLAMELQCFLNSEHHEVIRRMAYRQIAWCYSLGNSLRKNSNVFTYTDGLLTSEDLDFLKEHQNKPLGLLQKQYQDLKFLTDQQHLSHFQQVQIDNNLVRLCDSMGKCERINNTVFPTTYSHLVTFFIYLFLVLLSFALIEIDDVYEAPILLVISTAFFLIQKTATLMQDPFRNLPTDTSVTTIARGIDINIRQLLGEKQLPQPIKPESFYIM
ncbi:MAG: bestrophin family ion channel [Phycisphaerales bacterium]|nr:bestrophin family ion channel [Phycisphaerales bacterium]